ncbi:MAG TPA: TonB-dependent receptor, partial [Bacteroidaceae bacterium]|nr:TonB-dependent receptor [Bacteroidaceae bacterium]
SDTRWGVMPTVGLSWVISNEEWMKNQDIIDFLKLRASFGVIQTDNIPYNGYWNSTVNSANGYPIDDNFSGGGWSEGRLPSLNGTTEKAHKYNVGLDMTLLKGLNIAVDGFYERRSDIWVATSGQNSSVLGNAGAYKNAGIVDSHGVEVALDYTANIGNVQVSAGGNFSFSRSEIKEMLEEPKAYDYLNYKGNRVGQIYALQAIGYFVDEADIANSYPQQFGPVKPGDIKYKDVNGDHVINEYDKVPMGYSSDVPEIYYGFHVGAEWKGLGFNANFQGVANYTALLDGVMYRPLVDNSNISQYYYNNRWTPENPNARFPRLTNETVDNNNQESSVWLADRSFLKLRNAEVYYKLPSDWISKIKLKQAKVYVRGVDLFSVDNDDITDPEVSSSLNPATRSVHVGLSIGL